MKPSLSFHFLVLLGCLAPAASAQDLKAKNDTVIEVTNPTEVTVVRRGNLINVDIKGSSQDARYVYVEPDSTLDINNEIVDLPALGKVAVSSKATRVRRVKKGVEEIWFEDFTLGRLRMTDTDLRDKASFELGIMNIFGYRYNLSARTAFSIGAGINYRQWTLRSGSQFTASDGRLSVIPTPEGVDKTSSRIMSSNITVPIFWRQYIGRNLTVKAGAVLNFNVYTAATTKVTTGYDTLTERFRHLNQRIFTPELYASIGWRDDVSIFFRWSPESVIKSGYGPKFGFYSVGFTFNF